MAALRSVQVFAGALVLSAGMAGAQASAPPIGGHFTLATPDGRTVTDETYRGKFLVVYFGYTSCPDVCPTVLSELVASLREIGPLADKIQPVFITVDPVRDTPKTIADYVAAFDPRLVGLRGTPEQTEAVAKEFHAYYRLRSLGGGEYTVDHSSFLYVMKPDGSFDELLAGNLPGHKLADELRRLAQ